ncbi:MAG: DUF692 family multinuclear iron-containing protein [Fimbriimonadaceae bacterium]
MKLAVNYSSEAMGLRESGQLPIDYLKCALFKDWITEAKKSGPIYVHFPFGVSPHGVTNFDHPETDWPWVFEVLNETDSIYLNLHIKIRENEYLDASRDAVLEECKKCVNELAMHVPMDRVIIENTVARAKDAPIVKTSTLGGFFTDLIKETGCGLLLDTAHLRISCLELGLDFREEVLKFPLHELNEWHICGVGLNPGGDVLFDSMPMTEEDWQATAFVVAAIREGIAREPYMVAIEYGGIGDKFDWRSDPMEIFQSCRTVKHMLDLI